MPATSSASIPIAAAPATPPTAMPPAGQDPLAQLRDIHLPEAVSAWPPAPGWWLVAALLLAFIGWVLYRVLKYYRRNRYRRQALVELLQLAGDKDQPQRYIQGLNRLLKQTSMAAQNKTENTIDRPTNSATAAALSGQRWLTFLDDSSKGRDHSAFSQGCGQVLQSGPYQRSSAASIQTIDCTALEQLARRWIKGHRINVDASKASSIPIQNMQRGQH